MMKLTNLASMVAVGLSCAYLTQCTSLPSTTLPPAPSSASNYPKLHTHQDTLDHFLHGEYGRPDGLSGEAHRPDTSPLVRPDDGIDHYRHERVIDRYRWLEGAVGNIDADYSSDPLYGKDNQATRQRNTFGTRLEQDIGDGQLNDRKAMRAPTPIFRGERGGYKDGQNSRFVADGPLDNRARDYVQRMPREETNPALADWIAAQDTLMQNYLVNDPIWQKTKANLDELLDYKTLVSKKKFDGVGTIEITRDFQNGTVVTLTDPYGDKQVILNEKDFNYHGLGGFGYTGLPVVSKKGTHIAYATQLSGADDDEYTLYVKEIKTGNIVATLAGSDTENFVWYDDDSFIYRSWPYILRHDIGVDRQHDPILLSMEKLDIRLSNEADSPAFDLYDASDDDKNRYFVVGGGLSISTFFIVDLKTGYIHQVHDEHYFNKANQTFASKYTTPAKLVHFDPKTRDVWFISTENTEKGEILKINLNNPRDRQVVAKTPADYDFMKEAVYYPESGGHFLISYLKDVSDKVVLVSSDGKTAKDLTPMTLGAAAKLTVHIAKDDKDSDKDDETDDKENYVRFDYSNTITPLKRYKYSIEKGEFIDERYPFPMPRFNPDDYEIKRVFYRSKDNTSIPMLIAHKKGLKLDGKNPTLVNAYGGFGIRGDFGFSYGNIAYLDAGFVYAEPFIRGGGEYGRAWHHAAKSVNRDRQFEDVAAAADYLSEHGYGDREHTALTGWSQGGFMTGAVLTTYPDKFRAAIPGAGVFDMFRFDAMDREDYFMKEYGYSWGSKDEFDAIKRWSPYQNVKAGVCYPSTLVVVPTRDDRVWPAHSYKFTAALQEHQACDNPILMFPVHGEGHNPITRQGQVDRLHRTIAFALKEIGVTDVPKNARPDFDSLKTDAQRAEEAKEQAKNEAEWQRNREKRDGN